MSRMKLNVKQKGFGRGINILELEVPAELERNISTGMNFFDDALGGEGATPSSSILFTGTPGAGKTTLCLQLADSITAAGNICLYNTCEESLVQVRKTAKRLKLKNGFIVGQDHLVSDILEHADEIRKDKANRGKQLFIIFDSLQTLDDGMYANGHTNSMTPLRVTEMITDYCKQHFAIAILIGQVTKDGTFAGKMQVKHAIDVHAHLYIDDAKKSETYGERIFEVQKNRFGCAGRNYIMEMNKSGIRERTTLAEE
jgi:DNA repair protein RadA/Sms